jgi:hypothetical protein
VRSAAYDPVPDAWLDGSCGYSWEIRKALEMEEEGSPAVVCWHEGQDQIERFYEKQILWILKNHVLRLIHVAAALVILPFLSK